MRFSESFRFLVTVLDWSNAFSVENPLIDECRVYSEEYIIYDVHVTILKSHEKRRQFIRKIAAGRVVSCERKSQFATAVVVFVAFKTRSWMR